MDNQPQTLERISPTAVRLRLSHGGTTRCTLLCSNNSKWLDDSKLLQSNVQLREMPEAPTALWGTCCYLVAGTLRYLLLRWPSSGIITAKTSISIRNVTQPFPLMLWGLIWGTVKVPAPYTYSMRRTLRRCGTHPPPSHLGRPLCARHGAIRLPWLPLSSDNSSHRLHAAAAALLKIQTHIHMHPYGNKEASFARQRAALSFLSIMCPFELAWADLARSMGALRRLATSQQIHFWPSAFQRKP